MIALCRVMITKLYKLGDRPKVRNGDKTQNKRHPWPMKILNYLVFIFLLMGSLCQALAVPEQGGSAARPLAPAGNDQAKKQDDARQRESERRPPKLSPEERKALRQQINEVGQDLYPPKR